MYPITLMYNELNWKFSVNYDPKLDMFTLSVNDVDVMKLPYQASTAPTEPELIMNNSKIYLNEKQIEMVRK